MMTIPSVQVVPVEIRNHGDFAVKPKFVKNSTLKTYLLDPSGNAPLSISAGVGPKWLQICDYEPTRIRTVIQVLDNPVCLSTDAPVVSPGTTAAGEPTPQGLLLVPSESNMYEFFGPDAFFLNAISNPSTVVLPSLTGVVDSQTKAIVATQAGSFFTPAPGESVAAFGVDFQAPGAAVLATITLSNVLGGPYTWTVTVPTTGLSWRPPFTVPVPASNSTVYPTLSVGAIVGGPAYTLSLQGLKANTLSRVTVLREYC